MSKITPRDIDSIAELFESGEWSTLELQVGATEIFLSKRPNVRPSWDRPGGSTAARPAAELAPIASHEPTSPHSAHPPTLQFDPQAELPDGHLIVSAPSLGTFYRAPKPGDPPFVELGDVVAADTELCLIEVMKLFTTLRAGIKGTVTRVLAPDGAMIELDQPLFVIDTRE